MTNFDLKETERRMRGALTVLKQEFGGLRTGRASAALLDPITVNAYGGSRLPLNQLATINVPDVVPGQSLYLPDAGVDGWFNPAAFAQPKTVTSTTGVPLIKFGNAQRRIGRGPGSNNLDFSLFKNFPIYERFKAQFRAEAFNLSNTPTFFLPAASSQALTIGNASFGKLSGSSATGRQIQMGIKLIF